eukprot:ANDGO_00811.mRNA.1 hypothetical protein
MSSTVNLAESLVFKLVSELPALVTHRNGLVSPSHDKPAFDAAAAAAASEVVTHAMSRTLQQLHKTLDPYVERQAASVQAESLGDALAVVQLRCDELEKTVSDLRAAVSDNVAQLKAVLGSAGSVVERKGRFAAWLTNATDESIPIGLDMSNIMSTMLDSSSNCIAPSMTMERCNGQSLLRHALENGHAKRVLCLLQHGADCLASEADGRTCFEVGIEMLRLPATELPENSSMCAAVASMAGSLPRLRTGPCAWLQDGMRRISPDNNLGMLLLDLVRRLYALDKTLKSFEEFYSVVKNSLGSCLTNKGLRSSFYVSMQPAMQKLGQVKNRICPSKRSDAEGHGDRELGVVTAQHDDVPSTPEEDIEDSVPDSPLQYASNTSPNSAVPNTFSSP